METTTSRSPLDAGAKKESAHQIDFVEAMGAEDLRKRLNEADPERVISIYTIGARHIAWFERRGQKKKGKSNGNSSQL